MIIFKYRNKVKKVNVDRHSTTEDVIAVVSNIFHLRSRVIGVVDQEGRDILFFNGI